MTGHFCRENEVYRQAILTVLLGVPAHICAVGLYFRGGRLCFACHPPPKTKPRYAGLVPKGVTIPNANATEICS